jgi:hypothetical protein
MPVALLGVPRRMRDSVCGDLLEQGSGLADAFAIAMQFQLEPYRDSDHRSAVLSVLFVGAAALWLVPAAASATASHAWIFVDTLSRAALVLWGMPCVLGAVACGLLVGRVIRLPPYAQAARLHSVVVLAVASAVTAPSNVLGLLAAMVLAATAWAAHLSSEAPPYGQAVDGPAT